MASTQNFVEYVCEQAGSTKPIIYKKMFGEYALYIDGKVVALVCDDEVFVKPTLDGIKLLKKPNQGSPYPGAKPHLCVTDHIDDRKLMASLFSVTADSLPPPKPKKIKVRKSTKQS